MSMSDCGGDFTGDATRTAMQLLSAHVPQTLLQDLALPNPHSQELFQTETGDLGWLSALVGELQSAPDHAETA